MNWRFRQYLCLLAGVSKHVGCFPVKIEALWQSIEPFGLPTRSNPHVKPPWHHCDPTGTDMLIHMWGALLKKLVYVARANTGHAITSWEAYEGVASRPPPPPPVLVIVVQEAEASEPTGEPVEEPRVDAEEVLRATPIKAEF